MYCPNCNLEFDSKFCPECGTKLVERVIMYCPNCNTEHDSKFCPDCGAKIVPKNAGDEAATQAVSGTTKSAVDEKIQEDGSSSTFAVVLMGLDRDKLLDVFELVKGVTDLNLEDVEALLYDGTFVIKEGFTKNEAEDLKNQLEDLGAIVELFEFSGGEIIPKEAKELFDTIKEHERLIKENETIKAFARIEMRKMHEEAIIQQMKAEHEQMSEAECEWQKRIREDDFEWQKEERKREADWELRKKEMMLRMEEMAMRKSERTDVSDQQTGDNSMTADMIMAANMKNIANLGVAAQAEMAAGIKKCCPTCGATVNADEMFCPECGTRFPDNKEA